MLHLCVREDRGCDSHELSRLDLNFLSFGEMQYAYCAKHTLKRCNLRWLYFCGVESLRYILVPHIPFVTQGSPFPVGAQPTPPFHPLVPFFLFLAIVDKVDIVGSLSQCVSPADHFFSRNEKKVDCVVPQVINSPDSDRLHKPQHKSFSSQPTRPTVVHVYVSDSNREQEEEKSLFT